MRIPIVHRLSVLVLVAMLGWTGSPPPADAHGTRAVGRTIAASARNAPPRQRSGAAVAASRSTPNARDSARAKSPNVTRIALESELEPKPEPDQGVTRPAWLDRDAEQVGDTYRVPVTSGPQERPEECTAPLDQRIQTAVAAYIDAYLGPVEAGGGRPSDVIRYDLAYIRRHLIKPDGTFDERLEMSFGPMYQQHALLEFGPEFRRELDGRRRELERYEQDVRVAARLCSLGGAFAIACLVLLIGWAYFRWAARYGAAAPG